MNHGFAKGRSCQANLASETWKCVALLFVVKLLLWVSVNEAEKRGEGEGLADWEEALRKARG